MRNYQGRQCKKDKESFDAGELGKDDELPGGQMSMHRTLQVHKNAVGVTLISVLDVTACLAEVMIR